MKFKNFIWDFDGTLFDTYPHICECFLMVLEKEGIRENFDEEMIMRHLRISFGSAKNYTGISEKVYQDFDELHHLTGEAEIKPSIVPFEDCEKVLRDIIAKGGKNFIYTHRNKSTLEHIRNFNMADCFSDYVCSEEHFPYKPAPDAILAIIERNGLNPAETIMIGDREIDGQSGKNAGICGALVNYYPRLPDGSNPASQSNMDYVADSLSDLWEMLKK